MKNRLNEVKKTVKRYAPVVAITAVATAVAIRKITRKSGTDWNAFVLNDEQRAAMASSADTCVVFPDEHVMILGKTWNPGK